MTADRPDPRFRAFDGVEPPEQWDDIVLRAERTEVALAPDAPARHRPARILAAAAALALVAGLAVVLFADRAGTPNSGVTSLAGEPTTTSADPTTDPADPSASSTTLPGAGGGLGTTLAPGSGSGAGGSGGAGSTGGSTGSGGSGSGSGAGTTMAGGGSSDTVAGGGGASGSSDGTTSTTAAPAGVTTTTATTVPPLTVTPAGSPFGRSWNLGSMTDTAGNRRLGTDRAIVLDATTDGRISLTVCNTLAGTAALVDGKLVVTLGPSTEMSCGSTLDGHETWLARLLSSSPTVNVTDNVLVLSNGTQRAEFDAL